MDFIFIDNKDDLGKLYIDLLENNEIFLDTETTSLDPFTCTLLLLQLEINNNIYVLDVRRLGKEFLNYFVNLVRDSNKLVIGHSIKFDAKILQRNTGTILLNLYDTMLSEILINAGIGVQYYSLDDLVYKYCGVYLNKEIRKSFENYTETYFTNEQVLYSAMDVKFLRKIREIQIETLTNQKQIPILELENKLEPIVAMMELDGVLLDSEQWRELDKVAREEAKNYENEILDFIINKIKQMKFSNCLDACKRFKVPVKGKALTNQLESISDTSYILDYLKANINTNSPTQMLEILKIIVDKDIPNTNEKTINKYKNKSELINIILNYREHSKKLSTYGENFFELIHPITGRIHVDMNQTGTSTGRFAIPRLHQIPKENSYRTPFIARPGNLILTIDYDQAELRLLAADSREPVMIDAFKNNEDIHKTTASVVFEKALELITPEERQDGKSLNFAIDYGSTAYGLFRNFGIPLERGEWLLKKYFQGYSTLKQYLDILGEKIWTVGYCPTMLGRRRYFSKPAMFESIKEFWSFKNRTLRELKNHRIQGTSADITKLAMNEIFYGNPFDHDKLRILIQAHDELVIEIHESIADDALIFIEEAMIRVEKPFLGDVPPAVSKKLDICWRK